MKFFRKLYIVVLLALSTSAFAWQYDQRWPTFQIDGIKFALTLQDGGLANPDLVLIYFDGLNWTSWGGMPTEKGTIVENLTDEKIMAKGSLAKFVEWSLLEATRRAKLKAEIPLPPADDKIKRMEYALTKLVTVLPGPVLKLSPIRPLP